MWNNKAFEQIAPRFTNGGWVFFAPYRRGQGLSESAGPFISDEILRAQKNRLLRDTPVIGIFVVFLIVMLFRNAHANRKWLRVISAVTLVMSGAAISYASQMSAGATMMMRALEWIKTQPFTNPNRIATGGNSLGGIVTVLAAERVSYCAAFDAAGGAISWSAAPLLRSHMKRAARYGATMYCNF